MQRRALWNVLAAWGSGALLTSKPGHAAGDTRERQSIRSRPTTNGLSVRDGTQLFYRDRGSGPPLVFIAPWALNSNWWEYQIAALADGGLRCVAYDRRGHGRSDDPGKGYELDTLADDLATLIEQLNLRDVTLIGHSMGCAEVVRYLSRHSGRHIARAVLISTITPFTLKTADNPDGVEESVLEKGRVALANDRPQQITAAAPAFFGVPHNSVSTEILDWWVRMILDQCSLKVMLDLHRVFTRTDFRNELRGISVPVLLIHGNRDVSTPIDSTSRPSARLIPGCQLKVYDNAAHGLPITHKEQLRRDLLAFVRA